MQTLSLLYHELRPTRTAYTYAIDMDGFSSHLELIARIRQTPHPPLWPEITFDDGHQSNHDLALPLLASRSLQARFFITAGWTGTRPGYMDWPHLRALLAAGHGIGAHGWSHTLLTHCSPQQLHQELHTARQTLEDRLATPITTLSLPGGRSNPRVLAACREAGYTEIFTSIPRAEPIPPGPTIGRLNILATMTLPWLTNLLQGETDTLHRLERSYRLKQTAKSLLGDRLYARLWSILNRAEPEAEAA